jgi:hypothetical protein
VWSCPLSAQSPDETNGSVRADDRYTYDTKDEITGEPKGTYASVVTEVSDNEIITVVSFRGRNGNQVVVLDHDLNRLEDPIWKFTTLDGQGIRLPLAVGKEYRQKYDAKNMQSGAMRSTDLSKVEAQDHNNTGGDVRYIQNRPTQHGRSDQASESEIVMWCAPRISR